LIFDDSFFVCFLFLCLLHANGQTFVSWSSTHIQ
jgi:hypothetical protein